MRWRRFLLAWFVPTSVHFAYGYTLRAIAWLAALVAMVLSSFRLGAWQIPLMLAWTIGQSVDGARLFPQIGRASCRERVCT